MSESVRRRIKEWIVSELAEDMKGRDCLLFVDIEKVNANEMATLRAYLRSNRVRLKVAKNRLIKRALAQIEKPQPEELLRGMTALAWGEDETDPVAVCRSLVDWQKKEGFPRVKGAIFLEQVLDEKSTLQVARMPTRNEMMAQIVGLFQNSLVGVVSVMQALLVKMLACFENLAQKLEKEQD